MQGVLQRLPRHAKNVVQFVFGKIQIGEIRCDPARSACSARPSAAGRLITGDLVDFIKARHAFACVFCGGAHPFKGFFFGIQALCC